MKGNWWLIFVNVPLLLFTVQGLPSKFDKSHSNDSSEDNSNDVDHLGSLNNFGIIKDMDVFYQIPDDVVLHMLSMFKNNTDNENTKSKLPNSQEQSESLNLDSDESDERIFDHNSQHTVIVDAIKHLAKSSNALLDNHSTSDDIDKLTENIVTSFVNETTNDSIISKLEELMESLTIDDILLFKQTHVVDDKIIRNATDHKTEAIILLVEETNAALNALYEALIKPFLTFFNIETFAHNKTVDQSNIAYFEDIIDNTEVLNDEKHLTEASIDGHTSTYDLMGDQNSTDALIDSHASTDPLIGNHSSPDALIDSHASTDALIDSHASTVASIGGHSSSVPLHISNNFISEMKE